MKAIDTVRQRKIIGWLGMALPWIVLLLSNIFEEPKLGFLPGSISETYYFSTCIVPFMIILGAAGIQLFSYRGYDTQDDVICSVAGLFAWGICLFPCASYLAEERVGTFNVPEAVSGTLHNTSAIIFFALLAYNSLFLFTKSCGEMTKNKKRRNIIFRVCGIGMIASFLLLVPLKIYNVHGAIWIVEAIALSFFGISWLTKANCYRWLFRDKKED